MKMKEVDPAGKVFAARNALQLHLHNNSAQKRQIKMVRTEDGTPAVGQSLAMDAGFLRGSQQIGVPLRDGTPKKALRIVKHINHE